ncbi:hypothetical protein PtrSN002B_000726 [Pyrenophora tritici-repentis]|uniref:Uncharacterized protein n=1 Tax=Pyrenophora tritici-repentis TaxID=45151 RepID=A0A2W1HE98_9PLEO|nr:hypothetical protein PtrV1_04175 [Pyrenophora tritici-repentis]KAF7451860.1 hypothetical protein A1F99_036370 [Pyrenophora tritici-repentis]KAF7575017.1 hypothetical protein PtrM4_066410 [Pyrenophora tritici-repentis]KAG9386218.1 hypothetical protein A1F94_002968 [Pyrenophora tritici-repentis]KAI0589994.1 hypothetical protein Alg215_00117 [Pyrenophora tritici-repentis]
MESLAASEALKARAHDMLHRILCHLKIDLEADWVPEIGENDYDYADKVSKEEAVKFSKARGLGDSLPKAGDLLQFLRFDMIENQGEADRSANQILLSYRSLLGFNSGSVFGSSSRQTKGPSFGVFGRQIPTTGLNIISPPSRLCWKIARLRAEHFFDAGQNVDLWRDFKTLYKQFILSSPHVLSKDSFVLILMIVLWGPLRIKAILRESGILYEEGWLDDMHVEKLLQVYRARTTDLAGMKCVWGSYSFLWHYLHFMHQDEDTELMVSEPSSNGKVDEDMEAVDAVMEDVVEEEGDQEDGREDDRDVQEAERVLVIRAPK